MEGGEQGYGGGREAREGEGEKADGREEGGGGGGRSQLESVEGEKRRNR